MQVSRASRGLHVAAALTLICLAGDAAARVSQELPPDLEQVGIEPKLDGRLPLDLEFVDQDGAPVELGRYFDGERPVILALAYYRCPMLCTLVLDGLVDSIKPLEWVAGEQFEVLTVSIDPREGPQLAKQKQQNYLRAYGKPGADRGWHFLTGGSSSIEKLADAVGFRYRFLEDEGEFAHAAAFFVITPDGRISRYLYGVRHDPQTVRLSLVEAAQGKVGSALDKFLLYCYRYDAEKGRYAPVAIRLMRVGGLITVTVLGFALLGLWLKESGLRRKRLA